jgi:hypothetical protein
MVKQTLFPKRKELWSGRKESRVSKRVEEHKIITERKE